MSSAHVKFCSCVYIFQGPNFVWNLGKMVLFCEKYKEFWVILGSKEEKKTVWLLEKYRKPVFQRGFAHFLAGNVFGLKTRLCKFCDKSVPSPGRRQHNTILSFGDTLQTTYFCFQFLSSFFIIWFCVIIATIWICLEIKCLPYERFFFFYWND